MSGTGGTVTHLSTGANYSLALRPTGILYAWGYNDSGQLGDGTTTSRSRPVVSGSAIPTRSTAAGSNFGLGVRADGTLWAWGDNLYGQLGLGTSGSGTGTINSVRVGTDADWVLVAAGDGHSLALKADGTAYTWGRNTSGQLGDGTTTARSVPTLMGGGLYSQLAAGTLSSLGLRADGTAYAWRNNGSGQLGDGTTTIRTTPTLVSGGGTYTQLAAGSYHSMGLRTDGTIYGWGYNGNGHIGDGTTTNRSVPTREATLGTGWTLLATNSLGDFSLARTTSGYFFASTGWNTSGQLGDNTTITQALRFDRVSPLRSWQPLPVTLLRFTARRTDPVTVALAWATASEQTNAGFGVEKSADGSAFVRLGFVAGAGSSSTVHTYTFVDRAAAAAYYRLAQTDADGTVTYAPVQYVPVAAAGQASSPLLLLPNPAHGAVQAQVPGLDPAATLTVFDGLGRLVRTAPANALSVAGLPAGIYVVRSGHLAQRLMVE